MFLRISGSSSMTNIFFMILSKKRKLDRDGRAFANLAVHLHLPAVQVGAAFHQKQAQPGAWTRPDVGSAVKGLKQLQLIFVGNANPGVANDADSVAAIL